MGEYRKTELLKMVKRGDAALVEHKVLGVQLEDGNVHWLQDHDEEAMDRFIGTFDVDGMIENRRVDRGLTARAESWLRKQRTIGAAIEHLLESDLVTRILKSSGVNGSKIKEIREGLKILNWGSPAARIKYIIQKLGSERANEIYAAVEAARADGKISGSEWISILKKAGI